MKKIGITLVLDMLLSANIFLLRILLQPLNQLLQSRKKTSIYLSVLMKQGERMNWLFLWDGSQRPASSLLLLNIWMWSSTVIIKCKKRISQWVLKIQIKISIIIMPLFLLNLKMSTMNFPCNQSQWWGIPLERNMEAQEFHLMKKSMEKV